MKALSLIVVGAALLTTSCVSKNTHYNDHWKSRSIGLRMGHHFLNYKADRDGADFWEFQKSQARDIGVTGRRHLLNSNPDNPFQ